MKNSWRIWNVLTIWVARCTREIKSGIAMAKGPFNRKKTLHQQTGLKFQVETSKVLHLEHSICMVLKLGHFGNRSEIRGKF